jgi:hypothetical protein
MIFKCHQTDKESCRLKRFVLLLLIITLAGTSIGMVRKVKTYPLNLRFEYNFSDLHK